MPPIAPLGLRIIVTRIAHTPAHVAGGRRSLLVPGTASGGCTRGWAASRVYLCAGSRSHLPLSTIANFVLLMLERSCFGRLNVGARLADGWTPAGPGRVLFSKPGYVRSARRLWYAAWVQTQPVARSKNSMVTLRFSDPPPPECPKCHHQEVEKLFPVVPRWLSCPKCGHMWSNRVRYARKGESEASIKGPGR